MKKILLTAGLFLISSLAVQAQISYPNRSPETVTNPNLLLYNALNTVTNIVLGVLVAVAVIFAIVSGYTYLTAAGDTAKVRKASEMLIYAGVAVGVGLLAKGVVNLVLRILGLGTTVI